jgi:hypothetical protein
MPQECLWLLEEAPRCGTTILIEHPQYETPPSYDWLHLIYGNDPEVLPPNMPEPKGKVVHHTTFFDANLYHDYITGRAAMGTFHFVQQTLSGGGQADKDELKPLLMGQNSLQPRQPWNKSTMFATLFE